MTIKLIPTYPKTVITVLELPDRLHAGEWITGRIVIRNDGDGGGTCRVIILTVWDGSIYGTKEAYLNPGQELEAIISEGVIKMPETDAVMEIRAEHLKDSEWIVDDKRTH